MSRPSLRGSLLISDTLEGSRDQLIHLSALVDQLERLLPGLVNAMWTIRRGADGSGDAVGKIIGELETDQTIDVQGSDIMDAIRTGEEWFDDVFIHVPAYGVDFGVHDSTALFFRGAESDMHAIESLFSKTRWLQ